MTLLVLGAGAALAVLVLAEPAPRTLGSTGAPRAVHLGRLELTGRRLVVVAAALAVALLLGPVPTVVGCGAIALVRWWGGRRAAARETAELELAVPDLVELLALALRSGASPANAVTVVARSQPGSAGRPFELASARLAAGLAPDDALGALAGLPGPFGPPLAELLVDGHRRGVPVADAVTDLARSGRDDRRRAIERRVQRLPVLLLGPLILCVLPSFLLIVCVPLVVTGLSDLL